MTARFFLVASLGFALLFNVAWSWGTGFLSGVAAAACTLIVPAGLHLWTLIPAGRWWQRLPRDLVLAGVCAAALITSFVHTVSVLTVAGWTELSAWSVTGGVELLVALSTMALLADKAPAGQAEQGGREQGADSPNSPPANTPDSPPNNVADTPPDSTPNTRPPDKRTASTPPGLTDLDDPIDDLRAWAASLGREPSGNEVRQRYGCGYRRATRLLDRLADDEEGDRADRAI